MVLGVLGVLFREDVCSMNVVDSWLPVSNYTLLLAVSTFGFFGDATLVFSFGYRLALLSGFRFTDVFR